MRSWRAVLCGSWTSCGITARYFKTCSPDTGDITYCSVGCRTLCHSISNIHLNYITVRRSFLNEPKTYNKAVFDRSRAAVVKHGGRVESLDELIIDRINTNWLQTHVVRTATSSAVDHYTRRQQQQYAASIHDDDYLTVIIQWRGTLWSTAMVAHLVR